MPKAVKEEKIKDIIEPSKKIEAKTEKKQKDRTEKTPEQLEHERQINEQLAPFEKAIEAKDIRTAYEEFSNYLASGKFIPVGKAHIAIEFLARQEAWEEGAQLYLGLLKRRISLKSRHQSITKILENSKPEIVKEIHDGMQPDERRKFKIFNTARPPNNFSLVTK